ncbi:Nuclear protein SET (modular protein) [Verrucomicrobia bacterium]|nr:Nuclear protein SET (modular protein) [Verrucomicrobiota bacterium]
MHLPIRLVAQTSAQPSILPLFEPRLSAAERYSNQNFYLAPCDVGLGVFARRLIRRAEIILRFEGPTISFAEAKARGPRECMTLQIGPDKYLDTLPPAVYVNHSCDPNTGIEDDRNLVALADIEPDEEIRFDYSTTMEEKSFTMRCCCGAPSCRKVVNDFSTLPRHLQQFYLERDVVMSFIRAQWPARTLHPRP